MRIGRLRAVVVTALTAVLSVAGGAPPVLATGTPAGARSGVLTATVLAFGDNPASAVGHPVSGITVSVVSAKTGVVLGAATSDVLGQVVVAGLPAATVKVRASASGWLTTWSPGERRQADARVLRVAASGVTDAGEVPIFKPASVQGQVLSGMDPIGYAKVTVFEAATHHALGSAIADGSGYYLVTGLFPGEIKVRASLAHYITNWADSFFQQTWETARVFTLAPGAVLSQSWDDPPALYLDIAREAVVEGQVLGDGRPLRGAKVTVWDAVTDLALKSARTNRSGHFRVEGLSAWGGRTVVVSASKPGWRTTWANGKPSRADATEFTLQPGDVLTLLPQPGLTVLDLTRRR